MLNAVIGLLLVLFTYTILYTINPEILNLKIFVESVDPAVSPATNTTNGTGGTNSQTNATGGNSSQPAGSRYVYSEAATDINGNCMILTHAYTTEADCRGQIERVQRNFPSGVGPSGEKIEILPSACVLGSPKPVKPGCK